MFEIATKGFERVETPIYTENGAFYDVSTLIPKNLPIFWESNFVTKNKSVLSINVMTMIQFLEYLGFRKVILKDVKDATEYVRVKNNILHPVSIPMIKDFFREFLAQVKGDLYADEIRITPSGHTLEELASYIYAKSDSLFKSSLLDMIKTFEGEMFQPKKYENAFFFKDAWVHITPDGMKVMDYRELPKNMAIWESDVVDFNIRQHDQTKVSCDFSKFIGLITGEGLKMDPELSKRRRTMLENAIGYLLHPFFEGALRAILITDVNSSMDEANGRTGKGLIAKALSQILPTAIVPAKRWTSKDKYNFEQANKDTKVVVLDDLASGFHAEELYNVITEGIVVKKIYQQPFTIWAKVMVNTNTMMRGDGSSTRGRFLEIEIDNFFSDRFKPVDYFKRNFFSKTDWGEGEWGAFYWYLMTCSYQNLVNVKAGIDCGVDYIESSNIELKRILTNVEQEFFDLMEVKCHNWRSNPRIANDLNVRAFEIKDIREEFLEEQNDRFRKLSNQKVRSWIQSYCKFKGYKLELVKKPANRSHYAIRFENQLFD